MSALPPRLTFVTIGARDHKKLRDFYVALGFPIGHDIEDNFASFVVGGVVLGIYREDLLAKEAGADPRPRSMMRVSMSVQST